MVVAMDGTGMEHFAASLGDRQAIIKDPAPLRVDYPSTTFIPRQSESAQATLQKVFNHIMEFPQYGYPAAPCFIVGQAGTGKTLFVQNCVEYAGKLAKDNNRVVVPFFHLMGSSTLNEGLLRFSKRLFQELPPKGVRMVSSTLYKHSRGIEWDAMRKLANEVWHAYHKTVLNDASAVVLFVCDEMRKDKHIDAFLYDIQRRESPLTVPIQSIMISNNKKFFQNQLDPRTESSLGNTLEALFPPYKSPELEAILQFRCQKALEPTAWSPEVIARIAALTERDFLADARKAIEMLEQASRVAIHAGAPSIQDDHIEQACTFLQEKDMAEQLDNLPLQSALGLACLQHLVRLKRRPIATSEAYEVYKALTTDNNFSKVQPRRFYDLLNQMADWGIIDASVISGGRRGRTGEWSLDNPDWIRNCLSRGGHAPVLIDEELDVDVFQWLQQHVTSAQQMLRS